MLTSSLPHHHLPTSSSYPSISTASSSSTTTLDPSTSSSIGLGYGEVSRGGRTTPEASSARPSIFFSTRDTTSAGRDPSSNPSSSFHSGLGTRTTSTSQRASSFSSPSSASKISSGKLDPFSGSTNLSPHSPLPSFAKDAPPRKKQPLPFATPPAPAFYDPALDDQQPKSPSPASGSGGGLLPAFNEDAFTTPTKKRKDEYDFERVFDRSASWSAKLTSPVAKMRLVGDGEDGGEKKRREEKRETRRVVDEVVKRAVESAEVKVVLSNKNLTYLPTSIEDLKYITRIEPIKPYLGLSAVKPRRVSAGVVASSSSSSLLQLASSPPTSPTPSPATTTIPSRPSTSTAVARPIGRTVSMPAQPSSSSSSSLTFANVLEGGEHHHSLAALREASAAADAPSGSGGGRRELGRSTTVNPSLSGGGTASSKVKGGGKGSRGELDLDLSDNRIMVLPRELFQLENLVYLSLRHNNLTRLPASISLLTSLKQLYIGNNQITTLPPTLLLMPHLETTGLIPNPFIPRHSYPHPLTLTSSGSLLSPPLHPSSSPSHPFPFPTLQEQCFRSLLSPHPARSNLPPFLNSSEILDRSALRSAKHLQSAFQPSNQLPNHQSHQHQLLVPEHLLSPERCLRILSALRSFASTCLEANSPKRLATTLLRDEEEEGELEDAAGDPFYSPCPGRKHRREGGREVLFLEAGEERLEWCCVPGAGEGEMFPVKWEGCGWGCLDHLGGWEEVGELGGVGGVVVEEEEGEEVDGFDVEGLDSGRAF